MVRNMKLYLPTNYKKNNPNILDYLKVLDSKEFHLIFIGVPGCGKTFLAQTIFDSIKNDAQIKTPCTMIECREIYNDYLIHTRSTYSNSNIKLSEIFGLPFKKNILFDDVGDERPNTPSAHNFVGGMIEALHKSIKKGKCKRSIITTNFSLDKLSEKYMVDDIDRITGRILEHHDVLKFKDKDFRSFNYKRIR